MGAEIDFAKKPEYVSERDKLANYFVEKLKNAGFEASIRENGNVTWSMTNHGGLDQVYAEITVDELEYHLDNGEWNAWSCELLNNDNESVDVVPTEVNAWTEAEAIQLATDVFNENEEMKPEYHIRVERNK